MKLPIEGDLIIINKTVDGVLISGTVDKNRGGGMPLGMCLVKISPDQTGLVLKTYNPKALLNTGVGIAKAADELLQAQQERIAKKVSPKKRPPYAEVPKEVCVIVITIGTNIIETVYDPEYMSILSI